MSNGKKERRCKSCGKLLLDEKLPFCRRCVLEGRNNVGKVVSIVGGLATTALTVALVNNHSNGNNDTTA